MYRFAGFWALRFGFSGRFRPVVAFGWPPTTIRPAIYGLGSQGVVMDATAWVGRKFEKAAHRVKRFVAFGFDALHRLERHVAVIGGCAFCSARP